MSTAYPLQPEASVTEMAENDTVQERTLIKEALRLYVGVGRDWKVSDLSVATRIPLSTLSAYCKGERAPGFRDIKRLCSILRAEFATRLFADTGLGVFDMPDDDAASRTDTLQLLATAMQAAADNYTKPEHQRRAADCQNVWPLMAAAAGREMNRKAA